MSGFFLASLRRWLCCLFDHEDWYCWYHPEKSCLGFTGFTSRLDEGNFESTMAEKLKKCQTVRQWKWWRPIVNGIVADSTSDDRRGKMFSYVQSALLVGMCVTTLQLVARSGNFCVYSLNVDPVDLVENVFLNFVQQSQRPVASVQTMQHQKACQGCIYSI